MKVEEFANKLDEITKYHVNNKEDCQMIAGMLEELVDEVNEDGIDD